MLNTGDWSSFGTEGGHIEVVDYLPEWPKVFEREAATIMQTCKP